MLRITLVGFFFLTIPFGIPQSQFFCGVGESFASEDLYESRLNSGLYNTETYSYILMKTADSDNLKSKELLEKAKKYSPDLPAVYFSLARENFSLSVSGIYGSIDYLKQGMDAYQRNFWWKLSLLELLFLSLIISYILSMLLIITIRFPVDANLFSHDILEEKRRAMLLLLLLIPSLLGPFALIAGVLSLIGLYFRRINKAVVYASLFFLSLSPLTLGVADTFLTAPSQEMKAVVDVNEGRNNRHGISALKDRDDFIPAFSRALALKKEGHYEDAISVYKGLLGRYSDSRIYINLGNSYHAIGDFEAAKESYKKSIDIKPRPSAFYNLSQVHRETLDFPKGEEYFLEAQKLDSNAVSMFTAHSGTGPNRFVVDESIPLSDLWAYSMTSSKGNSLLWVQTGKIATVFALIMAIVFYQINKTLKHKASECERCGVIFCSKCSRALSWMKMCPECFKSLVKIDETDSKERIAKLLSIYYSRTKKRRNTKIMSFLLPGAGLIYSGSILSGLLFMWPFLFFLAVLVMNQIAFFGVYPFMHGLLTPLAAIFLVITYTISTLYVIRRMQKGWL